MQSSLNCCCWDLICLLQKQYLPYPVSYPLETQKKKSFALLNVYTN